MNEELTLTPGLELFKVPRELPARHTAAQLVGTPLGRRWSVSATLSVSYDVWLTTNLLDPQTDTLETFAFGGPGQRRLVIVEERVFELFGDQLRAYMAARSLVAELVCVGADETLKNVDLALRIVRAMDEFGVDRRREPVVAIGGGVLLDVVGWVASLYRRGAPYVRVPTTLVGLVDAGIGVKTGVNHDGHKNRLGTYHAPSVVLLDPGFLTSLEARHISNGMAEIAKVALMCDGRLWELLSTHAPDLVRTALGRRGGVDTEAGDEVISRAVHCMLAELQPNLWEAELYRLVDFGHTFSPALEMAALPKLLHGEAVAVDMAVSCAVAAGRSLMSLAVLDDVLATLQSMALPLIHPMCTLDVLLDGLADAVCHRAGRQRIPVPTEPGSAVFLDDVTAAELATALRMVHEFIRDSRAHR